MTSPLPGRLSGGGGEKDQHDDDGQLEERYINQESGGKWKKIMGPGGKDPKGNKDHSLLCSCVDCKAGKTRKTSMMGNNNLISKVTRFCISDVFYLFLTIIWCLMIVYLLIMATEKCPQHCHNKCPSSVLVQEQNQEEKMSMEMIYVDENYTTFPISLYGMKSCCCRNATDHEGCWCTPEKKWLHAQTFSKDSDPSALRLIERRDVWKFHPCEPGCLNCDNLEDACAWLSAEGACWIAEHEFE